MADAKDAITGKTARLLNRLPHFYKPASLGKAFLGLYDVLGASLERCEHDLFEVLRAHHVSTAENIGSKGYIAPPKEHGDLDKLFSLYLETLGGTSQLVSMNPLFTSRSFNIALSLNTLTESKQPLVAQLYELLQKQHSEDAGLLERYRTDYCHFVSEEVTGPFVFALLTGSHPLANHLINLLGSAVSNKLSTYLGDGIVPAELAQAIAEGLNEKVLKSPYLFQKNYAFFSSLPLSEAVKQLAYAYNKDFVKQALTQQYEERPADFGDDPNNLQLALDALDYIALPEHPQMLGLQRLNRALLNAASNQAPGHGWGFYKKDVPTKKTVSTWLKQRFNALLEAGQADVQGFFDQLVQQMYDPKALQQQYADNPLMLRRFLLESILPYEIKHIYRTYQERQQALIEVLQKGAATKAGIKDIVAANFGMIGDAPEVKKAKQLISIIEYNPEPTEYTRQALPLQTEFSLFNTNQDPTSPEIRLKVLKPVGHLKRSITRYRNLAIIDQDTGERFTIPLELGIDDTVVIKDGELSLNGVRSHKKIEGKVHQLPAQKKATWMIDGELLSPNTQQFGRYGQHDISKFGEGVLVNKDWPLIQVEVLSEKLTYGTFSIVIPWHIDGVTDNFEETADHPRHMIKSLVNKVKAAGVQTSVSYFQNFSETHELTSHLNFEVSGPLMAEANQLEDHFSIDSRMANTETHDVSDELRASGVFGYTSFDSGNTFG